MSFEVRSSPLPKPPAERWPRCDMMQSIFELWWRRSAAQHHCLWACLLGRHTSLWWLTSPHSTAQSYHSTLISATRLKQVRSQNTITATTINLCWPCLPQHTKLELPFHCMHRDCTGPEAEAGHRNGGLRGGREGHLIVS